MKRILFISLILIGFLHPQELPVVHVIPFEPNDQSAKKAYSVFRSYLSNTGRVKLFSEEAWGHIFSTDRIMLSLNDFRNSTKAIELGKMTMVDYIAVGELNAQYDQKTLTIEWINLHNGLIEKTFSFVYTEDESDLNEQIEKTVQKIIDFVIKVGRVAGWNAKKQVFLQLPELSGWQQGDEFFLINRLNFPYGRVRLTAFRKDTALAEPLYIHDRLTIGDRAVFSARLKQNETYRPLAYLEPFFLSSNNYRYEKVPLQVRQIIIDSGKFDLLETIVNKPYYYFRFVLDKQYNDRIYTVNLSIIKQPGNKIENEKAVECLPADLDKTVQILLAFALNRWEQQALITRVSDSTVTIDQGHNQNVRRGQKVLFKEPDENAVLGKGKVSEVYADHSIINKENTQLFLRTGYLAVFPYDKSAQNRWNKALLNIHKRAESEKQKILDDKAVKRSILQKAKIREDLLNVPKSRLRVGYTYPYFLSEQNKGLFNRYSSSQLDVDLYLGRHPNFHFVFYYGYSNLNIVNDEGYIYANMAGLGGRLMYSLASFISIYAEALATYAMYNNHIDPASNNLSKSKWNSSYLVFRGGMDLLISTGLSLYIEGGLRRKLVEEVINLEYNTFSAGVAIWF